MVGTRVADGLSPGSLIEANPIVNRFHTMFTQNCMLRLAFLASIAIVPAFAMAEMRKWQDVSGVYSVTAELVTSDDSLVVLEKQNGELEILLIEQLSPADREYVKEHLASEATGADGVEKPLKALSRWHLQDGSVIEGELTGFGSQQMIVRRERGELWVNEYKLNALPTAYAKVIPSVVSAVDGKPIEDLEKLERHLADGGGGPFEYVVEGIQLQLDEGGAITIPLALLTSSDAREIAPNFARWKAAQAEDISEEDRYATQSRERLVLDSYQRLRVQEAVRQRELKVLELGLLQVATGITDVWEVTLLPNTAYGYPRAVVVSARDSLEAEFRVQQMYPGWRLGPVRKLSY